MIRLSKKTNNHFNISQSAELSARSTEDGDVKQKNWAFSEGKNAPTPAQFVDRTREKERISSDFLCLKRRGIQSIEKWYEKNHIKISYIIRCKRRGYFTLKTEAVWYKF